MDEVPVVNANPVNIIIKKTEKETGRQKTSQIVVSLKNLVYMLPLAVVVLIQMFLLGKSFGTFSTLPYTSFSTFVFVAAIAVCLFFIQLLQRSIVYSTLGGLIFLSGIFYAWFGDFHTTILANLGNVDTIIKASWTRKDIPFPLLMAGIMTFGMLGIGFMQFFVSLFVKSFFETFFGKDWGDGNWMGFVGAIALLIGVHTGFYFYASLASNTDNRLQWEYLQKYKPVEKYLTSVPGAVMVAKNRLYSSHNETVRGILLDGGIVHEEKRIKTPVIRKGFQKTETPVFFGEKDIICFSGEMNVENWRVSYPATFPELLVSAEVLQNIDYTPLTSFFVSSEKQLLVFYNYGYIGLYDMANGNNLWLKSVDRQAPARKFFSDDFPSVEFFHETEDRIIFSCQNGIIKAIRKTDGSEIWHYSHDNPKFNGKPQRAFLSAQSEKILASFKTGEMMTLAIENGRVIYRGRNDAFSFKTAPVFKDLTAEFLTDEGFYFIVEVDGAKILHSENLLPRKLDFLPFVTAIEHGIVAHKGEALKVEDRKVKTLLNLSNRVFVTKPVFDDKLMYIGTQDGWIYCVHHGSQDEKWKIHVNGELEEDSLHIAGSQLLVKTRAGSIISIDRRFI